MGRSVRRIAMWSGPRNISTALMRSFEARGDTLVTDEPLYASYLVRTGLDHPGRAEVIASQATDPRAVLHDLRTRDLGLPIWYQKHMAHHLREEDEDACATGFDHAFLLRDPARMLASLAQVLPKVRLEDTGLPQQVRLFERGGGRAPVIDSQDVLQDPSRTLQALCKALDIPWTERMLRWAKGPRSTDGVWAPHWYAKVIESTGFEAPPAGPPPELHGELAEVLAAARPLYARLAAHRLR